MTYVCVCRAFASWKEFMVVSSEKRAKVQKASRACFASSLQRAWATWRTHVHRHHLLRKALEGRQVSSHLQASSAVLHDVTGDTTGKRICNSTGHGLHFMIAYLCLSLCVSGS